MFALFLLRRSYSHTRWSGEVEASGGGGAFCCLSAISSRRAPTNLRAIGSRSTEPVLCRLSLQAEKFENMSKMLNLENDILELEMRASKRSGLNRLECSLNDVV